jgi:hypothetical protein
VDNGESGQWTMARVNNVRGDNGRVENGIVDNGIVDNGRVDTDRLPHPAAEWIMARVDNGKSE